ncbi:hypothetical protein PM082_007068 [Marasmius tenuissimus]|nr:hypothetical protein PM082_007068 [Marasmius tenuissimus]
MSIVYPTKGLNSPQSQICHFFLKGRCSYGEKCFKSHGRNGGAVDPQINEPKSPSDTRSVQNSPFSGIPTKPCVYWLQGKCLKGNNCTFLHDAVVKDREPRQRLAGEGITDIKPVPLSGEDPRFRTRPCTYWAQGNCLKGDSCTFRHDAAEKGLHEPTAEPQRRPREEEVADIYSALFHLPPARNCVYWGQGICYHGASCIFRHDPAMRGTLERDDEARRLLVEEDLWGSDSVSQSSEQSRSAWTPYRDCTYWARGRCFHGEKCTFRHDPAVREALYSKAEAQRGPDEDSSGSDSASQSSQPSHSAWTPYRDCTYWARGRCSKGDECTFRHDPTVGEMLDPEAELQQQPAAEKPANSVPQSIQHSRSSWSPHRDCVYWTKGRCFHGEKCTFRHDPAVKEALDREAEAQRQQAAEELAEKERLMREREAEARSEKLRLEDERMRLESEKTMQHLALGSTIVKFSAGLNVERVVTGFDACRIRITNLPFTAKYFDVCNFLREQGMGEEEMYHLQIDLRSNSKEASIIVEAERGRDIASGLDSVDFHGQSLNAELCDSGTVGGMHSIDGGVLLVSWWLPCKRYVATYVSQEAAAIKLSLRDGWVIDGRGIRVEGDRRNRDRARMVFNNNNNDTPLFISGVPVHVPKRTIEYLFDPLSLKELSPLEYDEDIAEEILKEHVEKAVGRHAVSFEPSRLNATQGNRSLRMRFNNWEDARTVHDQLKGKKFSYIGNSKFALWLSDPYQIIIPIQQYLAQKTLWDSLEEDTKGRKGGILHLRVFDTKASIRVGGNDKKAVGMLKVRVERLVAGEALQKTWQPWFSTVEGQKFLDSVTDTTGTYIRHDWKSKVLKGYADAAAIAAARALMEGEIERLSRSEYTQTLKPESVRFFLSEGLSELREAVGRDSVTLDISPSVRITVRGGEDARRLLRDLIDRSLSNVTPNLSSQSGSSCPICFMDVDTPVKLGCGHEYCTACLRHFFAADVKKFPFLCIGDEARCGEPIALPVIQKYLESELAFNTLLETAFTTYIEQNPQKFGYCKTPDCKQIYPSESSDSARQCPSCLASVCTQCHEEGHDGMTCEERRRQFDPAEQDRLNKEWAKGAGAKRCPSCQVWIEKTEGCNHMTCKCGAHICWVCVRVFKEDTIYVHMQHRHGGIYGAGRRAQQSRS